MKNVIAAICIAVLSIALAPTIADAQKVKLEEGDLSALKGVKEFNMQFGYSDMGVGKYKDEKDYVADKVEKYNEKEAGKGDKWKKSWEADREYRFEKEFIKLFEKYSSADASKKSKAKYTILFNTTFTEPGWNIYIKKKNALIEGDALIVETSNPNNVIAKIRITNAKGRTFGGDDYDTGERISESYALAGKGLGKFLKKKL